MSANEPRLFIGRGPAPDGRPRRWRTETLDEAQTAAYIAEGRVDDPADYDADPGLVDAMNVALLLGRPLLLTGRPGTGKSQFAERVAWEFDLAPVLRFEAQSVSEAQDLFYRFDTIGRLGASQKGEARARDYLALSALGKAVLYSMPALEAAPDVPLLRPPHPAPRQGRASVVLIDEIDKASRDFPNDLLNQIEKLSFTVPELENRSFEAARGSERRPIIVITSNSERELPEPFLRRCIYYNIPDPLDERLRRIVATRVLARLPQHSGGGAGDGAGAALPKLFHELVSCFVAYRDKSGQRVLFRPGTSELLDLARVVAHDREVRPGESLKLDVNIASAKRAAAAVAKGQNDAGEFRQHLDRWTPGGSS
jgi:MoxR-like ATPase